MKCFLIKGLSVRDSKSVPCSSKLSFVLYTGHLFRKGWLLILTNSCHICLHLHKNALALLGGWVREPSKPTKWIVDWFWVPNEGEKEPLLEQGNLDSVLKWISTSNPASIVNLKIENEGKYFRIFAILQFKMVKWTENELTSP